MSSQPPSTSLALLPPSPDRLGVLTGTARVLRGEASRKCNKEVHRKYLSDAALADQKVGPVFAAWDDITVQFAPESVMMWDMRQADEHVFGGAFKNNPAYLLPLER